MREIVEEVEDDSLIFNWKNVTLETGDKAEMIYKETDCPSSLNADTTRMAFQSRPRVTLVQSAAPPQRLPALCGSAAGRQALCPRQEFGF